MRRINNRCPNRFTIYADRRDPIGFIVDCQCDSFLSSCFTSVLIWFLSSRTSENVDAMDTAIDRTAARTTGSSLYATAMQKNVNHKRPMSQAMTLRTLESVITSRV